MRPIIRLSNLIEEHGDSLNTCPGCEICSEINKLRELINRNQVDRFQTILNKGQDMTKSEIELLLKNEVRRIDIKNALGMDWKDFKEMMKSLGLDSKSIRQKRKMEELGLLPKEKKFTITINEFINLFYEKKQSLTEIARLKNVSPGKVRYWRLLNKEKVDEIAEQMGMLS